jgi:uroporphyrinogen-III synthase
MRRILVLRPEPGATATVGRARDLGLDAVAVPLFEVEPVRWTAPDGGRFDALLLTSANAVRHGGEGLQLYRHLPVYAVGEATARAAGEAGFTIAFVGDSNVDRLLDAIPPDLELLHLCGQHRKAPSGARQAITPVAVYRATEIPEPRLSGFAEGVALIHSPRAGHRFAELAKDRGKIAIAAISEAAAEAAGAGWAEVITASEPNDEALLALAARLCNKPATP